MLQAHLQKLIFWKITDMTVTLNCLWMHGGSCLSFESGLLLCAESTLVVDGNLKMTLHD